MYGIRRGDIFYVSRVGYQVGSEQHAGRPAVVVSNDENNKHSETIEVVFCTTKAKTELPTHVDISSTPHKSTVLCEQITSVSTDRLENYIGNCTEEEMDMIDKALQISVGLYVSEPTVETPDEIPPESEEKGLQEAYLAAITERDTYRALYEGLLDKIMLKKC